MYLYICTPYNLRALSSVGSEHLPYKQGVAGSNPAGPTNNPLWWVIIFNYFVNV